jgi:RNA-directed DNA polymerase
LDKAKPFAISKRQVWEAYKRVKANQGAAGVDGQSIAGFEEDLENNLYKLWNRLASGSYFPPSVRRVEIPKGEGRGTRPLGIPTVSDRVAQAVAKAYLEPEVETHFGSLVFRVDCMSLIIKRTVHILSDRSKGAGISGTDLKCHNNAF